MTELAAKNTPPTPMRRAADLSAVLYREYALLARNRVNLILGLTPMLVYLLLVNTALSNVVGAISYKGVQLPFEVFLLPMVLAMSVVSASGTTGIALFQEELSGVSIQLWSYPLRRSRFLLGKLLASVSLVVTQTLLAVVVAIFILRYPIEAANWLGLLAGLVLTSVAFNGIYLALAMLITEFRSFMVLTNVSMPVLVFTAPSVATTEQLPVALQWVSVVNPVTYGVNAMRDAAIFGLGAAWPNLVVLAAVAVVANGIAGHALLRRTRNL